MKKFMFYILISMSMMTLTGCGRQTQNSPAAINQPPGVADIIEERIADADSSSEANNEPADEDAAATADAVMIPTETITITETTADTANMGGDDDGVDVDLTKLSSTMVYAEVFSMLSTPRNYIGKTVRMRGDYSFVKDPKTDAMYHACLIKDATACCAQGLEFVLNDDYKYPADYPKPGDEVTIVGQFNFYSEGDFIFYNLIDAVWEKQE